MLLVPALIAAAGCGGPSSPLPAPSMQAEPVPDPGAPPQPGPTEPAPTPEPSPLPPQCGTGIAAVDLSGVCRAVPNATMGALEAVGG